MKDDAIYASRVVGPGSCIPRTLTRSLYLSLPIGKLEIVIIPYIKQAFVIAVYKPL